jgi:excisionase family DNA binding protein
MGESPTQSDLLTVPEAAQLLRMKPSTMRDWIFKKRVPYVKYSRRVFLRRTDIEALISENIVRASGVRQKQPTLRVNDGGLNNEYH